MPEIIKNGGELTPSATVIPISQSAKVEYQWGSLTLLLLDLDALGVKKTQESITQAIAEGLSPVTIWYKPNYTLGQIEEYVEAFAQAGAPIFAREEGEGLAECWKRYSDKLPNRNSVPPRPHRLSTSRYPG